MSVEGVCDFKQLQTFLVSGNNLLQLLCPPLFLEMVQASPELLLNAHFMKTFIMCMHNIRVGRDLMPVQS